MLIQCYNDAIQIIFELAEIHVELDQWLIWEELWSNFIFILVLIVRIVVINRRIGVIKALSSVSTLFKMGCINTWTACTIVVPTDAVKNNSFTKTFVRPLIKLGWWILLCRSLVTSRYFVRILMNRLRNSLIWIAWRIVKISIVSS